ncbi:Methyl-accepting chemotaxis protein (MCP) signalling domain-containing protein [Soonwooa buanensis]|uniref:Methyl-accepting chemotaxis protein (MCP) signalling domain-containing protein n=1 Tax=Soonwooa buanensis TaxID=619805 RepID=A0A1T5GBH3_9FLAO|nr:DUF1003 domain-containing protein [Soonwooa buanensis]SKC05671.1 Methyl-accepting chemotaxis protein (MCP) signalling domain-containing protein [Soonwooa buanensis]
MKLTDENQEKLSALENIANGIMWWIGSIPSLVVHTIFFILCFALPIIGLVDWDHMLLVLTTLLSLEAIYLAIFIQMSVNKSSEHIEVLREDVEEIQEDIDEIQEDIEEISEDIEEISEDIEDISEDIEEINEDIDEIQEDIEEINEDEEDEDHGERARTVMLKSKVSSNRYEIKQLRDKISELESLIDRIKEKEKEEGE